MSTKQKPTPLTDALSFDNAGRIAVLKHARRMERDRAELLAALERLNIATCLILQSKPVRDMDEALFEARAAIAKAKA